MLLFDPAIAEIWRSLCARLPRLKGYTGPAEVPQTVVITELRALGIGSTDHLLLPQLCCYSATFERAKVKLICSLRVGDGRLDWVEASGPDRQEALCRAALRALEWKERQDAGPR